MGEADLTKDGEDSGARKRRDGVAAGPRRIFTPVFFGVIGTIVIAGFVIFWSISRECTDCGTKFQQLLAMKPSEVGDTIAGFASVLAFLWLVVTALTQAQELRAQREELAATRDELALAREVQEQQLETMRVQADVFLDEQRQRMEERGKKNLDQLIETLWANISEESDLPKNWSFKSRSGLYEGPKLLFSGVKGDSLEDRLRRAGQKAAEYLLFMKLEEESERIRKKSECRPFYLKLKDISDEILASEETLSQDQILRVERMNISGMRASLEALLELDIWEEVPPQ